MRVEYTQHVQQMMHSTRLYYTHKSQLQIIKRLFVETPGLQPREETKTAAAVSPTAGTACGKVSVSLFLSRHSGSTFQSVKKNIYCVRTIARAKGTTPVRGATASAIPLWFRSRQTVSLAKHARSGKKSNDLRASTTCTFCSWWGAQDTS